MLIFINVKTKYKKKTNNEKKPNIFFELYK